MTTTQALEQAREIAYDVISTAERERRIAVALMRRWTDGMHSLRGRIVLSFDGELFIVKEVEHVRAEADKLEKL